jgi:hypothetical protein
VSLVHNVSNKNDDVSTKNCFGFFAPSSHKISRSTQQFQIIVTMAFTQDAPSHEFGSDFQSNEADHILSLFVNDADFEIDASSEGNKRSRDEDGEDAAKRAKVEISTNSSIVKATPTPAGPAEPLTKPSAPWFYYKDYSRQIDPSPETPLTLPGRIPSFPVKMLAILSRKDISGKFKIFTSKEQAKQAFETKAH